MNLSLPSRSVVAPIDQVRANTKICSIDYSKSSTSSTVTFLVSVSMYSAKWQSKILMRLYIMLLSTENTGSLQFFLMNLIMSGTYLVNMASMDAYIPFLFLNASGIVFNQHLMRGAFPRAPGSI